MDIGNLDNILTKEEQQELLKVIDPELLKPNNSDRFVEELQKYNLSDKEIARAVGLAQHVLKLWLLRHIVDNTTVKERETMNKTTSLLSPLQSFALWSTVVKKKLGKDLEQLGDELWERVLDAYLSDIQMLKEELAKKSK